MTQNENPPPTLAQLQQQPQRPTFDEHVFNACKYFSKQLLTEVPELQGLAVIPTWHVPQPHLPFGVVSGQEGPLAKPSELIHMLESLLAVSLQHFDKVRSMMVAHDQRLAAIAEEYRDKTSQLEEVQKQIEEADAELAGKTQAIELGRQRDAAPDS